MVMAKWGAALRASRAFTLVELLVVLGLMAIVAVPLAALLRGTITSQEQTAETAQAWKEAAESLRRLSDDIRAADGAEALAPTHLKLTLQGDEVHYRGGRGLHRITPTEEGQEWSSYSAETLLDGTGKTDVTFYVNEEGLVTVYLAGDEVRLRTAALPRGGVVDLVSEKEMDGAEAEGGGVEEKGSLGGER
jgi:prepilin-type N-terminal cleavage/methylation domain-containing protein